MSFTQAKKDLVDQTLSEFGACLFVVGIFGGIFGTMAAHPVYFSPLAVLAGIFLYTYVRAMATGEKPAYPKAWTFILLPLLLGVAPFLATAYWIAPAIEARIFL